MFVLGGSRPGICGFGEGSISTKQAESGTYSLLKRVLSLSTERCLLEALCCTLGEGAAGSERRQPATVGGRWMNRDTWLLFHSRFPPPVSPCGRFASFPSVSAKGRWKRPAFCSVPACKRGCLALVCFYPWWWMYQVLPSLPFFPRWKSNKYLKIFPWEIEKHLTFFLKKKKIRQMSVSPNGFFPPLFETFIGSCFCESSNI